MTRKSLDVNFYMKKRSLKSSQNKNVNFRLSDSFWKNYNSDCKICMSLSNKHKLQLHIIQHHIKTLNTPTLDPKYQSIPL